MNKGMSWYRLMAGLVLIFLIVLALAWYAGGREPVREMVQPIPLPDLPR